MPLECQTISSTISKTSSRTVLSSPRSTKSNTTPYANTMSLSNSVNQRVSYSKPIQVLAKVPSLQFLVPSSLLWHLNGRIGKLLTNESAAEIARAKGKSIAQVLLRWGLQKGTGALFFFPFILHRSPYCPLVVLPKSSHEVRIKENADLFGWELSLEEMSRLDSLDQSHHFCWDPNGIP